MERELSSFERYRLAAGSFEPVTPSLLTSELKPAEELVAVRDLVTALHDSTRPADPILCTAWIESYGVTNYIETNHP